MDWGRRQELAATVNNQYKYYKNREVEDRLQKERDNLRVYLWIVLTLSLLMMVAAFILHLVRKEKRLKSLHGLNGVVNSLRRYQGIEPEPAMENKRLRSEDAYIVRMKFNLIESENCFGQVTENLAEAKQQIKQKDEGWPRQDERYSRRKMIWQESRSFSCVRNSNWRKQSGGWQRK